MNREITTGGASIYPLQGDVVSSAGNNTVTVVGLNTIPLGLGFPTGNEVLTYDATTNTLELEQPAQQIDLQTNGVDNSTQSLLNLAAGSNVTLTESGGTVTIAATGGGGGTTRGATNTNINGSWWVWSDGILEMWGNISVLASLGQPLNTGTITFPTAFINNVQSLVVTVDGLPKAGPADIAGAQVSAVTLTGATVNLQCSVPSGGGGATFDQNVAVFWRAIGS